MAPGITKRKISGAPRRKKPPVIAHVTEACTGCAGSPVCQAYCPVEECMVLVPNPAAEVFQVIEVDAAKCIGCRKCVATGPNGTYLDGCPWDAIVLIETSEYEARFGPLPH